MDGVLQLTTLLVALTGAPDPAVHLVPHSRPDPALHLVPDSRPDRAATVVAVYGQADPWLSEDKFRHAAASWAAMVFTYAAVRAVHDDSDAAFAVALPVTAALGIAKEVADRRRGGPFSFRDLVADALGAGAAWLFLREMR